MMRPPPMPNIPANTPASVPTSSNPTTCIPPPASRLFRRIRETGLVDFGPAPDLERDVGSVGRDRGNTRGQELADLVGLVDRPRMNRQVDHRGLREKRRAHEVLARR